MTLPPIVAIYYTTLDVWGEESFISQHAYYHKKIYLTLVGITLATLFFRGLGERLYGAGSEYTRSLEALLISVKKIMVAKGHRFRSQLPLIKKTSNVFDMITHPENQIKVILEEAKHFITEHLGLHEEQFDITIIRCGPYKPEPMFFAWLNQSWKRTLPDKICAATSTARHCLETGEECFFESKKAAEKDGLYHFSDRDIRNKYVGSIFCRPLLVDLPEASDRYLITFATYGVTVCDVNDKEGKKSIQFIFGEFARRIELELTLKSIQSWKYNLSKNKASK
ncbi:hypothetical protein [Rosistilla oblonga]|uniref:hypothetical protein n=1 Tax=Rosistilla oblonga TaxID=2527990 RepID=UPI003A97EF47